ncbi:hypothetical protein [Mucilaginibacter sp.]|jgi:hypothetical protein|uniref:hypothetical protein n=1 Tax=Mucilaginibacter sp. TaxID=1882438 RepID=UPI003569B0FF
MAAPSKKPTDKNTPGSRSYTGPNKDLNTDMPLSEKDEVKKAEERTAKAAKRSSK